MCNLIFRNSVAIIFTVISLFFGNLVSSHSLGSADLPSSRCAYALGRNSPLSESSLQAKENDAIVLYKEDGPLGLWCTENGEIVKVVALEKSELEKLQLERSLESAQFHEPSFLREDSTSKQCKHGKVTKDARHLAESSFRGADALVNGDKISTISGENNDGVTYRKRFVRQGRIFFPSLWGPPPPPPGFMGPYGPPPPGYGFGPPPPPPYGYDDDHFW